MRHGCRRATVRTTIGVSSAGGDVAGVVAFVRHETHVLKDALRRWMGGRRCIRRPIAARHEHWLSSIAVVRRCYGTDVAGSLEELYRLHGRVAARIERPLDPALDASVTTAVRRALEHDIDATSHRALAALERSLATRTDRFPPG